MKAESPAESAPHTATSRGSPATRARTTTGTKRSSRRSRRRNRPPDRCELVRGPDRPPRISEGAPELPRAQKGRPCARLWATTTAACPVPHSRCTPGAGLPPLPGRRASLRRGTQSSSWPPMVRPEGDEREAAPCSPPLPAGRARPSPSRVGARPSLFEGSRPSTRGSMHRCAPSVNGRRNVAEPSVPITSLRVGDLVMVFMRRCVVRGFTPQGAHTPRVFFDDVEAPGVQLVVPIEDLGSALVPQDRRPAPSGPEQR